MAINWGGSVDELVASWWRPAVGLVCGFSVAACCFFPATNTLALPLAAGLAGGAGVLRTLDKKTVAATPGATAANTSGSPKSG
jgi:hypothetical protein